MTRIPGTADADVQNGTAKQDSILSTQGDELLRGRGGMTCSTVVPTVMSFRIQAGMTLSLISALPPQT